MKLCGSAICSRICRLVVLINLLIMSGYAYSQNLPPVLSSGIPNQHAVTDSLFSYTIPNDAFRDSNNDNLTFTAEAVPVSAWPSWLTFDESSKRFSGTPNSSTSLNIKVRASDSGGLYSEKTFKIIVHPYGSTYAAFTMNTQIGCNSKYVQFENKSNRASSFRWNFGNGNISTLPTPIANYTKPGTYTVTLQINNDPGLVYTDYIYIYPSPRPSIDESISGGCELYQATLNSTGTPEEVGSFTELGQDVGEITGGAEKYYYWYSEKFPENPERFSLTKTVTVGSLENGLYTVALEVTDENGCSGTRNYEDLFEVWDKPKASYSYIKSDPCRPSSVSFTRESELIGSQITEHEWKVNGVVRGSDDNFQYTFPAGEHIVSLVETSEHGCISAPFNDTIVFNTSNTVNFTFTPAITCLNNNVQFNSQIGAGGTAVSYSWDFDNDGLTDSENKNTENIFTTSGLNPVSLTVEFDDGCVKEVEKNVPIEEVIADFNYVYQGGCDNYMTVDFSDISTTTLGSSITSRKWYWRQSGAANWSQFSVDQNPILPIIPEGIYDIRLISTCSTGCNDTIVETIPLISSSIDMNIAGATTGCFPSDETNFTAIFNSDYDTPGSYNWQFGDGETGTGAAISHTYGAPGNYNITLTIQTEDGCTYTLTRNNAVQFANQPVISDVTLHQDDNCFNTPIILEIDYPTGTDSLRIYLPGDSIVYIKNLGTPNHMFSHRFKDIGNFSIGVEAIDNNCHSDVFTVNDIQINGPKAAFIPEETAFCSNPPYSARFINTTSNNTPSIFYTWDFGDGSSISGVESPVHNYTTTGDFNVLMTARDTDSGCEDTFVQTISVYSFDNTPGIIEASDTSGCAPLKVEFKQNIQKRLSDNYLISNYEWDFNNDGKTDSTTTSASIEYTYSTPGRYSVGLKVNSESGCSYSFTENNLIRARGNIVAFDHSPLIVCSGTEVSFTNNSTKPAGDTGTPVSFIWNFGDGSTASTSNATHQYGRDTIFSVSLEITDSNGCIQKLEKKDLINIQPFTAGYTIEENIACSGSEVTFVNISEGDNLIFVWDFDNDSNPDLTTSDDTVTFVYDQPGEFTPLLTVRTQSGCLKSASQNLHIVNATAEFSAAATIIGCAPSNASFTPEASPSDVISYTWSFGDGITSSERSPVHRYYTPGFYDVSLYIEFKGGCFRNESKTKYIFVKGAYAELNYDTAPACSPNEVEFVLTDMRSVDYIQWDFGDGQGEQYSVTGDPVTDTIWYSYISSGYRKPSVVLSSNDCPGSYTYEKNITGSESIEIYTSLPPSAEIWTDRSVICQGVGIQFRDSSQVRDTVYPASKWEWIFSSTHAVSDVSNEQNPVYAYSTNGYFHPKLIVSNDLGCKDSSTTQVEIKKISNISSDFSASDYLVCPDQIIEFNGTASSLNGAITSYKWDFGDGEYPSSINTVHAFDDSFRGRTVDVLFVATDEVLCSDSTTRTVDINNLQAALGYRPQPVYRGGLVDFEDLSVSDFNTSVQTWNWSFENGDPSVSIIQDPVNILYDEISNGNNVRLIVSNNNGCFDTVSVLLDVINNPPQLTSFPLSILRNTIYTFSASDFSSNFQPNDPGQTMEYIRIAGQPTIGVLTYNGVLVNTGQLISTANIGGLKYTSITEGTGYFSWNAWDGKGYSDNDAQVNIEILREPDPPVLNDLVYNVPEDYILNIELDTFKNEFYFDNNTFPGFNLDSLKINSIPLAQQGSLTFNGSAVYPGQKFNATQIATGLFTIDPVNGYEGSISFRWNGFDGLKWSTSDASVIINYVNAPPVLTDIIFENLAEDSVINLQKVDFTSRYYDPDINDLPVNFLLDIPAQTKGVFRINGVVATSGVNSIPFSLFTTLRYTPENGGNDIVDVRWGAYDGQDITYAVLRITYKNTPPICHDVILNSNEDEVLRFTYLAFSEKYTIGPFQDPDEFDVLDSIKIVSLPIYGEIKYLTLPFTIPYSRGKNFISNLRYTPNADWSGTDTIIYQGFDGTEWSTNISMIIINVAPVNDPPKPEADYYVINEDRPLVGVNIKTNDIDIDDDWSILTVNLKDGGTAGDNGTIALNHNGYLNYRPNSDFNGGVWFTYEICDDEPDCSVDTVYIEYLPMNDPPTAVNDSVKIYETTIIYNSDVTTNLLINDFDIDESPIHLVLAGGAEPGIEMTGSYGTIVINYDGSFTYIPNPDSVIKLDQSDIGRDIFDYTISDDSLSTSTAKITILITGSNNPPEVQTDTLKIKEGDVSVFFSSLIKNDFDPEGKELSITQVNNTTDNQFIDNWGEISWSSNGNITYTQNNYSTDYLTEGQILDIQYQYSVTDGQMTNNSGLVIIRITGTNDTPIAVTDNLIFEEEWDSIKVINTDFSWLLRNDYDPDDYINSLSVVEINGVKDFWEPAQGTVGILRWNNDGTYTYIPDKDSIIQLKESDIITDIFRYTLTDPWGATDNDSLIISIIGANNKPNPENDTLRILEDTFTRTVPADSGLLVNDSDPEHQKIIVEINGLSSGTISGLYGVLLWDSTGAYTYVSDPEKVNPFPKDSIKQDVFTYTIKDPEGSFETASLSVIITGQNDAPVSVNDYEYIKEKDPALVQQDPTLGMLKGDSDIDTGDTIRVISINDLSDQIITGIYGVLEWSSDGTYKYTLNEKVDTLSMNEEVSDIFTYIISDMNDSTGSADLIINITGENDNPLALNDTLFISEDTLTKNFNSPEELLLYNDTDKDKDPIKLVSLNNNPGSPFRSKYCTIEWDSTGAFKYIRNTELDTIPYGTIVRDSIRYSITDQYNFDSSAWLHIYIIGENDTPVAIEDRNNMIETTDSIYCNYDTGLLSNDYDVDSGDSIKVLSVKDRTGYILFGNYGDLYWSPDGSYTYYINIEATDSLKEGEIVEDLFTYTITDNNLATDIDTLIITIKGVNDVPVASDDYINIEEDTISATLLPGENGLLENDYDIDGDEISVLFINNSEERIFESKYGSVIWAADGLFIFTPDDKVVDLLKSGEVVTDSIPYIIKDELGRKDTALIFISITGENDNPVANEDHFRIDEDTDSIKGTIEEMTSVLSNDTDIDGDPLSLFKVNDSISSPALNIYGNLSWNTVGTFTFYTNRSETDKLAYGDTISTYFSYIATDPFSGSDTSKLVIEIIGVNDPPVALPDSFMTLDVKSVVISAEDDNDILENDYDVDGEIRLISSVNEIQRDTIVGKYGVLIWKPDGSFEYHPDSISAVTLRPGETLDDDFSYIIKDEWDSTGSSIINLRIIGINNAPVAKNITLYVNEDDISKQLPGLGLVDAMNAIDPDRDTLQASSVDNSYDFVASGIYGGLFWKNDGTAVYIPDSTIIHQLGPNQKVTERFTYTIKDYELESNIANLDVVLLGMNDVINAVDDIVNVDEDKIIRYNVVENDEDPDNFKDGNFDYSSLTILSGPYNGKSYINSSNGMISYFPDKNFNGMDSIRYSICDTGIPIYCDDAWMIITVNPINDKPIATPLILETKINSPISFDALKQVEDIDDGIKPNSIDIVGADKIELANNEITYTPDSAFVGKDEFTYSASDFEGERAYVIVTVIVKDTLSTYSAANDTIATNEDVSVEVNILTNDTIGGEYPDPRTVEVKVFPKNGTVEYDWFNQIIKYTPDKDFNGKDSLEYIVSSGLKNWSSASVFVSVEPVNDSLIAVDDFAETLINTPVEIRIFENDIDGDNGIDFTRVIFSKPNIVPDYETGIATYSPPQNFIGFDSFTYIVCDNDYVNTSCDSAEVTVLINPKNSISFASNDDYITKENTDVKLENPFPPWSNDTLFANQVIPDSFRVILPPQHGDYVIDDNTNILTYRPSKNFYGNDWITYGIYDDAGNFDVAEINIWVEKENIAPVTNNDNYMISQNETKRLYVLENDFDTDGYLELSTLEILEGPSLGVGSVDKNTGTIFYKPEVNKGDDSLKYRICDNEGACSTATLRITVELDTSIFIYLSTYEDMPVSVDTKAEMEKYNFKFDISEVIVEEAPIIGDWSFNSDNTKLTYTPDKDSTGNDNFRLNVCSNEEGMCAYLRIYVKILPVNDPPVAINDTIIWNYLTDTTEISFNDILKNDYDIDSETIILTPKEVDKGDSLHFKFSINENLITITADTIFWCDAWFMYEIKDDEGASDTAKVLIFPDPHSYDFVAKDDFEEVFENSSDNLLDILNNDIFIDNQRCTIDTVLIIKNPENGKASSTTDNFISYSPVRHFYGFDSLQYQIIDIWGKKSTAWVYIEVIQKNSPPIARDDDTTVIFGAEIQIPVLINDEDPDAIDLPGSPGDPNAYLDSSRTHIITEPLYGTVEKIYIDTLTMTFKYTPNIESCENDYFEYKVYDNENDSATARVTIIMPAEAPITAINDTVKTYPGIPVEAEPLINDLGYFVPYIYEYGTPSNGFISISKDNVVRYTPNNDFIGRDSISYTIISPCENTSMGYIVFLVEELRVPEIITPNGDNKNDVLIIDGIEYFPDNMLQIYNRYGHIIYSKKGYDNTWGGYSNKGSLFGDKPLPAGTYYWTLIYNEGRNRQAGILYIFR